MEELLQKWNEIKEALRVDHQMTDVSFRTWIEPLELYRVDNGTVSILTNLDGSRDYISNKYAIPFKVLIEEMTGKAYEIEIITPQMVADRSYHAEEEAIRPEAKIPISNINLNSKYTFDTFVVGSNNRFAHAASLAVAENPGDIYNPLFLYGGVGLGKTHLMHSIADFIIKKDPRKRVLYVTSESFTNDLIDAIRVGKSGNNNAMNSFREKYRSIDVLLIDDIQFIIGKDATQEEFFHTFNDLYSNHKAIIISSDKPPKEFDTLEERYRTRFEWGITADINPPDFETRMAILHKKEEMDHLERYRIPNDVMEYIATNVTTNIRELEGSLNKLVALATLQEREINISLAQDALKDIVSSDSRKEITPSLIMDIVSEHYHITIEDILSPKRNAEIVEPRQIIMYLCRKLTNARYQEIGDLLGNRDHSTIKHGEKTIANEITTNHNLNNTVDILTKKILPS